MFIHYLKSVLWIRIRGSGPFLLDPEPDLFLDQDPWIQVILCFYWIPGEIWGHLDFWILKIRQGVQKLGIFCHGVQILAKKMNFLADMTMLLLSLKMESAHGGINRSHHVIYSMISWDLKWLFLVKVVWHSYQWVSLLHKVYTWTSSPIDILSHFGKNVRNNTAHHFDSNFVGVSMSLARFNLFTTCTSKLFEIPFDLTCRSRSKLYFRVLMYPSEQAQQQRSMNPMC